MTIRQLDDPDFGPIRCATAQDFCDFLDANEWSGRRAALILGLNEKTVYKWIEAPSETLIPRTLTLALCAIRAGLNNY